MTQFDEDSQATLSPKMGLPLFISPCLCHKSRQKPRHTALQHHPPPDLPVRIHVGGPAIAIERLFPHIWNLEHGKRTFSQQAGPKLARLTFQTLYERDVCPDVADDMVIRDEYLGWMKETAPEATRELAFYGVTFDHLVPGHETSPNVLQISMLEIESDRGTYANTLLCHPVDPTEYIGKKVLAVPRCCQNRDGTNDRWRVNNCFDERVYSRS
ncbi:hypothetical protein N7540_010822 [Penicillium herquei]|nr:hypothetical protein N7540_010822 [Penicillium herquei]